MKKEERGERREERGERREEREESEERDDAIMVSKFEANKKIALTNA